MSVLRVGVLMGGKSLEREVSFNSGRTVCDHLDVSRYNAVPIFQTASGLLYILPWKFLHRGKISDFEQRLEHEAERIAWDDLKTIIDFMYITTVGRYGEDGSLQGFLEILGIPYIGSGVFASALCMDKSMQKYVLNAHAIETPRSIIVPPSHVAYFEKHRDTILLDMTSNSITFPCVVKPHKEGSSLGVSLVYDQESLEHAIKKACYVFDHKPQAVVIEEKIEGMEFTCIVLTDYRTNTLFALPPTEIVPESGTTFFDYEQKYMPGRALKMTPARTDTATLAKIQNVCVHVAHVLELQTIGRIDGFVTRDNRIVIIDPNSLSGMAPSSFIFTQAAEVNISHTQLINHLIETSLESYGMLHAIERREQEERTIEQPQKKLRVGVLLGGASNEKEISLESGRNVMYKLSPAQYETTPLFVDSQLHVHTLTQAQLVCNSTQEIVANLSPTQRIRWSDLPRDYDFIFIGLHGGVGENGSVQGALEMLGLPYNGSSVLASALCMDKYKTTEYLKARGFDVPQSYLVTKDKWMHDYHAELQTITERSPWPLIIKPHDDGCSVMVQKATSVGELRQAIEVLFTNNKTAALIEECITGMELTVGVIGNDTPRALVPSYAVATNDILSIQEKFLPGAGENQTPAPLSAQALLLVQETMEHVYAAIGCKGYARIDCFYQSAEHSNIGKDRVIILEINTLPGLTPATCLFHQAAEVGLKPMEFIDMIVRYGLEEHGKETVPKHHSQEYNQRLDNVNMVENNNILTGR